MTTQALKAIPERGFEENWAAMTPEDQRVGEILAVADAVIFPFPKGAGEWNTLLKAAQAAGAFTLATTQNSNMIGYHESKNTYFAACDDIIDMRNALNKYIGNRNAIQTENEWEKIAVAHERVYKQLVDKIQ